MRVDIVLTHCEGGENTARSSRVYDNVVEHMPLRIIDCDDAFSGVCLCACDGMSDGADALDVSKWYLDADGDGDGARKCIHSMEYMLPKQTAKSR